MSKRKNGEGSWGKKTIKGILYHYYRDVNGKYTYGRTQKEVNTKLNKKKSKQLVLDEKTTFGEYIMNWLQSKKKTVLEESAYDCYETMIESQIIKYKEYDLANKQLKNLSSDVFQEYLDSLAKKYSRATIQKIWAIIKQCIEYGEIKNEIPHYTSKLVKVPIESAVKVKKKEVPFLEEDDMERFYNASKLKYSNGKLIFGVNAKAAVFIMYSGLRVSEMIALKWKNVDIKNKVIHIKESQGEKKNRNNDNGKKYLRYDKNPKTEDSERHVPLPKRAMDILREFNDDNPNHRPNDYVFVNKNQNFINRRNINRTIQAIARRGQCSVQDFSAHSLRHTYGSILLQKKVDIKKVSELLGHSDITTTYNIYIGVSEKAKQDAVEMAFDQ